MALPHRKKLNVNGSFIHTARTMLEEGGIRGLGGSEKSKENRKRNRQSITSSPPGKNPKVVSVCTISTYSIEYFRERKRWTRTRIFHENFRHCVWKKTSMRSPGATAHTSMMHRHHHPQYDRNLIILPKNYDAFFQSK